MFNNVYKYEIMEPVSNDKYGDKNNCLLFQIDYIFSYVTMMLTSQKRVI
jgi:hypothetical protein